MSGRKGQSKPQPKPQITLPERIDRKTREKLETTFKEGHRYLVSKANEHLNSKKKNKKEKQAEIEIGQEWNSFAESFKSASKFLSGDLTSNSLDDEGMKEYEQNLTGFYNFLVSKRKSQVYGEFCQNMIDKLIGFFGTVKAEIPVSQKHKQAEEAYVLKQAQKPVFVQNNNKNRGNKYAELARKNRQNLFSSEQVKNEVKKVDIPKFNIDINGEEIQTEVQDPVIKEEVSDMLQSIADNVVGKITQLEEKQEEVLLEDEIPNKIYPQIDVKEEDVLITEEPVLEHLPLLGNEKDESVKVPSLDIKPKGKKKKVIIIEVVSCKECDQDEDIKQFMGIEN